MVFIGFLLDFQHLRDSVKTKPASSLVVLLEKEHNGILPSLRIRLMVTLYSVIKILPDYRIFGISRIGSRQPMI